MSTGFRVAQGDDAARFSTTTRNIVWEFLAEMTLGIWAIIRGTLSMQVVCFKVWVRTSNGRECLLFPRLGFGISFKVVRNTVVILVGSFNLWGG